MMVIEYAYKREDTQDILKPMTLSFIMYIARQYTQQYKETVPWEAFRPDYPVYGRPLR